MGVAIESVWSVSHGGLGSRDLRLGRTPATAAHGAQAAHDRVGHELGDRARRDARHGPVAASARARPSSLRMRAFDADRDHYAASRQHRAGERVAEHAASDRPPVRDDAATSRGMSHPRAERVCVVSLRAPELERVDHDLPRPRRPSGRGATRRRPILSKASTVSSSSRARPLPSISIDRRRRPAAAGRNGSGDADAPPSADPLSSSPREGWQQHLDATPRRPDGENDVAGRRIQSKFPGEGPRWLKAPPAKRVSDHLVEVRIPPSPLYRSCLNPRRTKRAGACEHSRPLGLLGRGAAWAGRGRATQRTLGAAVPPRCHRERP